MKPHVFALARVFGCKAHAIDFINGALYLSPLMSFVDGPDDGGGLRSDALEAVWGQFHPERLAEVRVGDHSIPLGEIVGPIRISSTKFRDSNLLCFYSIDSRGLPPTFTERELPRVRRSLRINADAARLGNHLVVLRDASEFRVRLTRALEDIGGRYVCGFVEYRPIADLHGMLDDKAVGFVKDEVFAHQREYRFLVEVPGHTGGPLRLHLGDLSDIAIRTTLKQFNRKLSLDLRNAEVRS